jgi:hypothetical protein
MANDFKRFTKASVTTSTGTSGDAIYTVPSSGSVAMESIIIGIYLSNKSSSGITSSVFLDGYGGSSTDVYLIKDATIPAGSSLEVVSGGKVVVQGNGTANDVVRLSCGTASALDATVSVLEDV